MNPASILIASSSLADAGLAADSLRSEFGHIALSCRAESAVADFERCRPDVLVLAFQELAAAQKYHELLRSNASETASAHPYRTLVLCRTEDVALAFGLCKAGRFDDYAQFWPMTFDIHRLQMCVLHGVRELRIEGVLAASATELAAHARRAVAIDPFLTQALVAGELQVLQTSATARQVEQQLQTLLDAAPDRAASAACRYSVQTMVDHAEALARWSSEVRCRVEPHVDALRALQHQLRAVHHAAPPAVPTPTPTPMRCSVLVIEDDPFQQKILARLVGMENFDCKVAASGADAIAAMTRKRPSLVLLDYMLPDTDGVALLKRLRAMPALAGVPVIMLTGNGEKEVVVASMQAGANDFMVKPVNALRLREKMRRYCIAA